MTEERRPSLSRRDFLKGLVVTPVATSMGIATGSETEKPDELMYGPEVTRTAQRFEKEFGVNKAKIQIFDDKPQPGGIRHSIHVPENPKNYILIGEIDNKKITNYPVPELESDENEKADTTFQHGLELVTAELWNREMRKLSEYGIVIAADSSEIMYRDHLGAISSNKLKEYLAYLVPTCGTSVGYMVGEIRISYLRKKNQVQPERSGMSRRDFLELGAKAGAGYAVGVLADTIGQISINEVRQTSQADEKIDLDQYKGLTREILEIYQDVPTYFTELRDSIMYINTLSSSAIKLPDQISNLQFPIGSAHTNIFNQEGKPIEEVYKDIDKNLETTLIENVYLILKHSDSNEDIHNIASTLLVYLSYFDPQLALVNKDKFDGDEDISTLRRRVSEFKCESASMLLAKKMNQMEQRIVSGEFTQVEEKKNKLKGAFAYAYALNLRNLEPYNEVEVRGENGEIGLPGNPDAIDTQIEAFGVTTSYSKGLPAKIEL